MMKIFVTRKIPQVGLDLLKQAGHEVAVSEFDRPLTREELMQKVAAADAILSQLVDKIDGEVMDMAGKQLKVIANYAVGYDNLNLKDAESRHILVTNTPDVLTDAVADHAFALMMAAARRVVESDRFSRAGKYTGWQPFLLLGQDVHGKTMGIVGMGRIGSTLAARAAKGFGMKVLYTDQKDNAQLDSEIGSKRVELNELLKTADFISVHVPLLPETRHMFSSKQFEMMKKTAVFVNTSRGPVVDEQALLDALKKGDIFGAGIDVWEFEPKLTPGLAELENIVITPHTASATIEARDNMSRVAAENIIAVLKGEQPPNLVKIT
ncbi:MAG: D-glycerate dehydrogenase [Candidatus Doudnabacteria bacterium RIFCSPLOWO2_01_FULL_44_21]|uniref:D-glycerate dehydrogenase n=1 Tax=Candidatus Doudnabacteria bacterium RIFCSPLOWO2_01_FULL_44_21 TaxID=1817841 RepID=A0A1F5PYI4_9BACT|nr:MAG: D-glycerate dehydrogenase [Candidatus Doudnabacteria bacterium RIFCSPHIGHO2_02_FULL_43_13b]OGE94772.1 MAG: D-glycerate dehydrogenase [Candidatus Doudnabacteria bacterium RIFCSPLOWO2_01_FULL_44_21]